MATTPTQQSAKIYAFPTQAALAARKFERQVEACKSANYIEFGSSWYHDEAVKEAESALNQH